MNGPDLFDPSVGPSRGWPTGAAAERAYLKAFARHGSRGLISNLRTRVLGLRWENEIFPVTVNDAEYGDSYVCLPHTAYALYAKAELGIVDVGPWAPALHLMADVAGGVFRAIEINRIVHLNNWMLSTNLHGSWRGDGLAEIRDLLVKTFPNHILAIRSINRWSDAELTARLARDGWKMLPSRQVYVTDDLDRNWEQRRNTRRDLRFFAKSPYTVDPLDVLRPGDAERIAHLYALLYVDKYSKLNPAFTPEFIEMTHRDGVFRYRGVRGDDDKLAAVVGCFVRGGILSTPIVGYDTALPVKDGLYRIACILSARMAQEFGARVNDSAGAARFKRSRGASPVIEFSAFFVEHLAWPRRAVIRGLEWLLNRVAVPLMTERGL